MILGGTQTARVVLHGDEGVVLDDPLAGPDAENSLEPGPVVDPLVLGDVVEGTEAVIILRVGQSEAPVGQTPQDLGSGDVGRGPEGNQRLGLDRRRNREATGKGNRFKKYVRKA